MHERSMPEIQRTALEATCLQTCSMTQIGVNNFLQNAMDPPAPSSVQHAMDRLMALGAITLDPNTNKEVLSPLGNILSSLPLDPAVGRMLIMACVMKCLDPILTAVATFSSRDVFYTPLEQRAEQRLARQSLCEQSDLMASIRAYDHFQKLVNEEGWQSAKEWAADHFVSISAMNSIMAIRSQLISELGRIGLIAKDDLRGPRRNPVLVDGAEVNRNATSEYLQVALWASGLPDNLASRRQLGHFGTLRTRTENHAGLHPSSVLFHRKPPDDRSIKLPDWFLYREMIQSSQVFLRGCTAIQTEQIALFGGNVLKTVGTVDGMKSKDLPLRVLDDWILLDGPCQESLELLVKARGEIQDALQLKVMEPRAPLPESSQKILDAVCQLCMKLGGDMDELNENMNVQSDNGYISKLDTINDSEKQTSIRERHRQLIREFFSVRSG
jgi:HrpA-like RNA helicase